MILVPQQQMLLNLVSTDIESLDKAIDGGIAPELMSISDLIHGQQKPLAILRNRKAKDFKPMVFVTFNTSCGKPKPVTIQVLLDSGASRSLIHKKFARKLKLKMSKSSTNWTTAAGGVTTNSKCKSQFCIPELEDKILLEYNLHVANTLVGYDMIIGHDILEDLGIVIDFKQKSASGDHQECPFKDMMLLLKPPTCRGTQSSPTSNRLYQEDS
jgi:predicted aspartyl protease